MEEQELLGMRNLAGKAYNIILFGGHGQTWISRPETDPAGHLRKFPDSMHHEVGVSLSGLFSLLRVDFAKRLGAAGFTIGLSTARIF